MSEEEKNPAGVRKLKELILYQENSVVSREIVSKETGTVTLFAFDCDRGTDLLSHSSPCSRNL